jgi:hypothetical protein
MGVAIKDDGGFVRERLDGRSRPGRVDVEAPIALWSHESGWVRGVLRNLSIGGMFVAMPRPLPIGTGVVARYSSAEGEPDEIEARVSWSRAAGTDGTPGGVGLEFIGPMVRAAVFVRVLLRSRVPRW